ncbi:MAG: hypothetical protein ACXWTS_10850 [Methylococcaceae bacterium]
MKAQTKLTAILLMVCSLYSGITWARGDGGHGGGGDHGGGHGRGGGGHGGSHYGYHGGGWGYRGGYGGYHGYSSFGIYLGWPYYSYPYYRYPYLTPYYYPPAIVTIPASPPVYIQKTPPANQQYPSGYWYYCYNPEGYYPYIKECPSGWQQVQPTPPAPR